MGSPYSQKEKRYDAERVGSLQSIQSQIIAYWQAKQILYVADYNSLTSWNTSTSPFIKLINTNGKISADLKSP